MQRIHAVPARRKKRYANICLHGVAGSGKTLTSIKISQALASNGKILVVDTENERSLDYAAHYAFDIVGIGEPFDPILITEALNYAVECRYDVVIFDSLSPFYAGAGGLLEINQETAMNKYKGNSFVAWNETGRLFEDIMTYLQDSPIHVIITLRVKDKYETWHDSDGKLFVQKVGVGPVMRSEYAYRFDLVGVLSPRHVMSIEKSVMCDIVRDDEEIIKPGLELGERIKRWSTEGETRDKRSVSLGLARSYFSAVKRPTITQFLNFLDRETGLNHTIEDIMSSRYVASKNIGSLKAMTQISSEGAYDLFEEMFNEATVSGKDG